MATNEEWVQIVDADNRPIGGTLRSEMRSKALRYRASYIFTFNCEGELFVQQRAHSKDKYPGWFDLAAGGVLREGEDYRSNAVREVEEELGITGAEMVDHGEFCVDHRDNRCWGRLFSCVAEGPFQFADGEVIGGFFTTSEKALDGTLSPITPDSILALQVLLCRQ